MNIICMLGISPSLALSYKYSSNSSLLLFILGILNHYNNSKKIKLKYTDRAYCLLIGIYGSYYYKQTRKIFCSIPFLFSLNYILYDKEYIDKKLANMLHVLFIQWPAMYAMYKILKIKDNNKYLLEDKH